MAPRDQRVGFVWLDAAQQLLGDGARHGWLAEPEPGAWPDDVVAILVVEEVDSDSGQAICLRASDARGLAAWLQVLANEAEGFSSDRARWRDDG